MNYKSMIVMTMMLAVLGISKPVFANMSEENNVEHVQAMRQAAMELKSTNPGLSDKLNGFAEKNEQWASKKDEAWKQKQADMETLKASAAALQSTRKDLADELTAMSDHYAKKMDGDGKKKY